MSPIMYSTLLVCVVLNLKLSVILLSVTTNPSMQASMAGKMKVDMVNFSYGEVAHWTDDGWVEVG